MVSGFLVSTVITGVVLLGIALFVRGLRERYDKPPDESSGFDAISAGVKDPRAWVVAYAVLILAAAGGAWAYIGGDAIPEAVASASLLVLGGALGIGILVFVGAGTYSAVRGHGRSSSQAAAMGGAAIGFVLLAVIAVKLVVA